MVRAPIDGSPELSIDILSFCDTLGFGSQGEGILSDSLLLVTSNHKLGERFTETLGVKGLAVRFETPTRVHSALVRDADIPYGAAVCVVETADEIAGVIRVKRARPELAVVMLSSIQNPAFRALGSQMGADIVLDLEGDLNRTAGTLLHALEDHKLGRGSSYSPETSEELADDIRLVSHATRELIAATLGVAAACEPGEFCTLVVEEAGEDSDTITRALREASVPPFLRTVRSVREAVHYLQGEMGYEDRSRFPHPKLVICDFDVPEESGLELLRLVRGHASLRHAGFIACMSGDQEKKRNEATRQGANFCVSKASKPDLLVGIVRAIFARFIQGRSGLAP